MHTINNFMFISNTQLIYFNVDCKIRQAAFSNLPLNRKTLKYIHLLIFN